MIFSWRSWRRCEKISILRFHQTLTNKKIKRLPDFSAAFVGIANKKESLCSLFVNAYTLFSAF
jgi:hypothetical protein